MSRQQWLKDLFGAIDGMDTAKFCEFLTENASFKFGNAETVEGKENIREMLTSFFSSIGGLSHTISDVVEQGDALVCRGEVTYTRKDSSELTVPFANFYRLRGNLASEYQIYVDASRLYA
jgi:ketosteroid isomerase-like protein